MKDLFALVRPACNFSGVMQDDAAIAVVDKKMIASNGFFTISQPVEFADFEIPSVDLEFALRRLSECEVDITEKSVILKSSNSTIRIKRLAPKLEIKEPAIETKKIKDVKNLLTVLTDILPFTEGSKQREWTRGARIDDKLITATDGITLISSELSESSGFEGVSLPREAIQYILHRGESLKEWGHNQYAVLLRFDDGAWARIARFQLEMPDSALDIVKGIDDWENMQEMAQVYKSALKAVIDYSDETVSIHSDHVVTKRFLTEYKADIKTKLADKKKPAHFTSKYLSVVVDAASEIGFNRYPNLVPFKTAIGSRGVIIGRTK